MPISSQNIHGSHFVKDFSACPSHSWWCQYHHKTFIGAILWKTFILSLAFLMMPISSQNHRPFMADFGRGNRQTGKNRLQSPQQCVRENPVLSHCFSGTKFLTKTDRCAGALSCKGETKCCFSIFQSISFWPRPYGDGVLSLRIAISTVRPRAVIPLNYTSEYQEIYEVTNYFYFNPHKFSSV